MKNSALIAILTVVASVMLFCGCAHNENCKPPFSSEEIPFVYDNEYHSCMDVIMNIVYLSKGYSESYMNSHPYPFQSHTGDTIKVCGYMRHWYHGGVFEYQDDWWTCFLTDDSLSAMGEIAFISAHFEIQGDHRDLLDSVDSWKKCYLTGFLTVNNPFRFNSIMGPISPNQCIIVEPRFQVIEIHN